jgi:hypothetical protein
MRNLRAKFAITILTVGLLASLSVAHAAHKAVVRAFAYHPVPEPGAVAVVAWDDSADDQRVRKAFQHALQARGRALDAEGPLELRFEMAVRRLGPAPREPSFGSVTGGSGTGIEAHFNVWSSTENSLLGGRQATRERRATVLQLTATLHERGGARRVLWRGEGQTDIANMSRAEAGARLAPELAARLGRAQSAITMELAP